jgi:hypothetical protein
MYEGANFIIFFQVSKIIFFLFIFYQFTFYKLSFGKVILG